MPRLAEARGAGKKTKSLGRPPLLQHHPRFRVMQQKSNTDLGEDRVFQCARRRQAYRGRSLRRHGRRRGRVLVGGRRHLRGAAARAVALGHSNQKACVDKRLVFGGRSDLTNPSLLLVSTPCCRVVYCCCALLSMLSFLLSCLGQDFSALVEERVKRGERERVARGHGRKNTEQKKKKTQAVPGAAKKTKNMSS